MSDLANQDIINVKNVIACHFFFFIFKFYQFLFPPQRPTILVS